MAGIPRGSRGAGPLSYHVTARLGALRPSSAPSRSPRPPIDDSRTLLATALAAADAAARVQLRWSGRLDTRGATLKGRGDFVSRADLEAQGAALAVIRGAHPHHQVLAEEDDHGSPAEAADRAADTPLWVVDPLDGTANFLHGHPMYASSVAVTLGGRPLAGAVSCPTTGERWWAVRGEGAWKNGRPIRVCAAEDLEGSLVGTGFPFKVLHLLPEYLGQLGRVLNAGGGVRRGGAAALDLCYLAEGRLDGFWELFLNPWDFAAGALVIEEAGGVTATMDRDDLPLAPGSVVAAGTAAFLARLRETLAGGSAG